MEEKERYKIDKSTNYYTNTIVDTKTNAYYGNIEEHIDLLNQQNKENAQLKQQLHDLPKKIAEEIREKAIGLWYFVLEEQRKRRAYDQASKALLDVIKDCRIDECYTRRVKELRKQGIKVSL